MNHMRLYDKRFNRWINGHVEAVTETHIQVGLLQHQLSDVEVERYTGMRDYHRKRIFEGDIIATSTWESDKIGPVVYDNHAACYCAMANDGDSIPLHSLKKRYIVGNIHGLEVNEDNYLSVIPFVWGVGLKAKLDFMNWREQLYRCDDNIRKLGHISERDAERFPHTLMIHFGRLLEGIGYEHDEQERTYRLTHNLLWTLILWSECHKVRINYPDTAMQRVTPSQEYDETKLIAEMGQLLGRIAILPKKNDTTAFLDKLAILVGKRHLSILEILQESLDGMTKYGAGVWTSVDKTKVAKTAEDDIYADASEDVEVE